MKKKTGQAHGFWSELKGASALGIFLWLCVATPFSFNKEGDKSPVFAYNLPTTMVAKKLDKGFFLEKSLFQPIFIQKHHKKQFKSSNNPQTPYN
jgi:hypothetical protein